ncbi:MAG: hypothetical protein D3904_13095, partial [Candidatus Electrothrix sp. EH2]|nr:hypothetical protein [Candidatus Electrothrix sp. EH2]
YHAFDKGASFLLKPFVRLDSTEDQRSHRDIREANIIYPAGQDISALPGNNALAESYCLRTQSRMPPPVSVPPVSSGKKERVAGAGSCACPA